MLIGSVGSSETLFPFFIRLASFAALQQGAFRTVDGGTASTVNWLSLQDLETPSGHIDEINRFGSILYHQAQALVSATRWKLLGIFLMLNFLQWNKPVIRERKCQALLGAAYH